MHISSFFYISLFINRKPSYKEYFLCHAFLYYQATKSTFYVMLSCIIRLLCALAFEYHPIYKMKAFNTGIFSRCKGFLLTIVMVYIIEDIPDFLDWNLHTVILLHDTECMLYTLNEGSFLLCKILDICKNLNFSSCH